MLEKQNMPERLFQIALVLLNIVAVAMLVLKFVYGRFSNDDLIAVMMVIFLGNLALVYIRRRRKAAVEE